MISEEKFYDKAKEFALLSNTKNEHYTLDEYREKVKPLQTGKDESVVYLYTTDAAKQDAFIQSANKKDYDVLVMNSPIDNHFISQLEQKLEKTSLKRVDSDVIDRLIQKEDAPAHVLTEEQTTKVKDVFEKAIQKPHMKVEIESLNPEELPVHVTMDEFMRRMKDMASMGGGMSFYGSMPDNYKVAINANHPLISRIAQAESDEEQAQLAKQAFDLALLSQGMLTGSELTEFVKRSVNLI
jgi:molecular chaperone HtpG